MTEREAYWSRFAGDFEENINHVVGHTDVHIVLKKLEKQRDLKKTFELDCRGRCRSKQGLEDGWRHYRDKLYNGRHGIPTLIGHDPPLPENLGQTVSTCTLTLAGAGDMLTNQGFDITLSQLLGVKSKAIFIKAMKSVSCFVIRLPFAVIDRH